MVGQKEMPEPRANLVEACRKGTAGTRRTGLARVAMTGGRTQSSSDRSAQNDQLETTIGRPATAGFGPASSHSLGMNSFQPSAPAAGGPGLPLRVLTARPTGGLALA